MWRAWGKAAQYRPRGHDDPLNAREFVDRRVVFVDIAPNNDALRALASTASEVIVLDHHISSQNRFRSEPDLADQMAEAGHLIRFDGEHSGAVLAWQHFHPDEPIPDLLAYIEDQDLWGWKLPRSEEVNAAISSYPRRFDVWSELASGSTDLLADQGAPIVRSNRMEVQRALHHLHPVTVDEARLEAVNARHLRSTIGHELAKRATYGHPCGVVYRIIGQRVDISIYSIGDMDVASIAAGFGGGGHRNAAGFSVCLREWIESFV